MFTHDGERATRHRRGRRAGILTALLATATLAASSVSAASSTPYGTNLIRNPGAQDGSASSSGNGVVAIPRWDTYLNMTVVRYGTSGFPSRARSNAFGGSSKFFSAGRLDTGLGQCGEAEQVIKLKGRSSLIDRGRIRVHLTARVAASGQARARVDLFFRDSNNHQVNGSNGIRKSLEGSGTSFRQLSGSRTLPAGTRTLRLKLWADGVSSGYCKAYFDNLRVTITKVS
jgi:hypothetical protein